MSFNKVNQTTGELTRIAGNGDIPIDSTPTQGSTNAVQSGGTFSAIKAVSDNVDELGSQMQTLTSAFVNNVNENGCKNVMPFDIAKIIAYNTNGTWSGNVFTYEGITYTVHEDSSLTVSGIATGTAELDFVNSDYLKGLSDGKVYKISGCPSGGGYSSKYCAFVYDITTSTRVATDDGSGSTFTFNASHQYNIGFVVWNGYDASTPLEVKLMLSLKSDYDADPTWVPPTKTNHQLTQDSVTWDNLSEVGAVNYLDSDASTTVDSSSGLTFTVNSDKTVTVSATSGTYPFTSTHLVNFVLKLKPEFSDKLPLKLSGCPSGGDEWHGYNLNYTNYSNTDNKVVDTGDGAIISTQFDYTTYPKAGIRIQLRNGTTLTGPLTFKPMLTDPSYKGPYVPYAKTNQQLTKDTTGLLDNQVATGVVNLAPFKGTTQIINGVQITFNSDGSITCDGVETDKKATANIRLPFGRFIAKKGVTYKITNNADGSVNNIAGRCLVMRNWSNGSWRASTDLNNNNYFFTPSEDTDIEVIVAINSILVVNNITFWPMVSVLSYNGPWVPYGGKSNKELTDESELITLPATKNDSIVGSAFVVKVRKQHNAVYISGYFNTAVAANRNDLLFTISGLTFLDANDHFYALIMSSTGVILFAEIYSDGAVKLGSEAVMPSGYYIIEAVLLVK